MGNNWPQFAIIIFFLLFSAISWTVRKLKEQNEVKRAREMAEAREREILRTGRDPNAEPLPDLTPPSQQIRPEPVLSPGADRRQLAAEQARAELRRLRQMRSPGAPMHAPGVSSPTSQPMSPAAGGPAPIRTELWPGGPVIEINPGAGANQPVPPPMPAQRPQPQSQQPMARPAATSAQRRTPTQAQRAQAQRRSDEDRAERAERARKQKALAAKREKESRELARDAREDAEELQRAGLTPVGNQPVNLHLPKTPEQWRSALVLNEILGQPLGMRSNQAGDLR